MYFLTNYGLFLLKTLTLVAAILLTVAGIAALSKSKEKVGNKIKIKHMNKKYARFKQALQDAILNKKELKLLTKETKTQLTALKQKQRKKLFYVDFNGDMRATQVTELREKITAILTVATPQDEVVVTVESGGGVVHTYGLCASQLTRLREKNIPLTIIIDKVAASGGYLMACVANQIIAAPFAIVGSIGVLVQLPNFHRFLKKHNIDFEQLSGGEYKRTLTLFGENTSKDREKMQEEIDKTHDLFKEFVQTYRPQLDIKKVATGEFWLGTQGFDLRLVDKIGTSDDYLLEASQHTDIYEVCYQTPLSLPQKFSRAFARVFQAPL